MLPITGRVGAVGLVAAGAVLSAPLGAGVASADQCPDVQVIFARGTNEPVGLGFTGQVFASALTAKLAGKAVAVSPVNYPASDDYVRSATVGADDDRVQIQSTVANCPDTDIVLGGYSQGAAVTQLATAALPPQDADRVVAVVLFGKPASEFSKMLAGGAALPTTGPLYVAKTLDLCIPDDPICSPGSNVIAHMSYITSGMTEQAATFAAGKIDQPAR